MKKIFLSLVGFLILGSFKIQAQGLKGAWEAVDANQTTLIIATESYITVSKFEANQFMSTWGGKYTLGVTNEVFIEVDFHSSNPDIVNSSQSYNMEIKKRGLEFDGSKFKKISADDNKLTGLWRITARANKEGAMEEIVPSPRKTYKIMAGGYFQWFAINTQSREFFGTGGGTYTLEKGVYSEHIIFFSRDNSRVGATLTFAAKVDDKVWEHSGKSSKGDPIKEIWTKQ
jgi:hypothetical protein